MALVAGGVFSLACLAAPPLPSYWAWQRRQGSHPSASQALCQGLENCQAVSIPPGFLCWMVEAGLVPPLAGLWLVSGRQGRRAWLPGYLAVSPASQE